VRAVPTPHPTGRRRAGRRSTVRGWSAVALLMLLLTSACATSPPSPSTGATPAGGTAADTVTIEVHRSAYCDCCGVYERYLTGEGFTVESNVREDVDALKDSLGIPYELGSCHTALVGGYFVEGHVPVEAIRKLLDERPAIDGIALPGMPAGSPGMPGQKDGDWVIYAVADGAVTEFMTL
jgi:hypothetical protein